MSNVVAFRPDRKGRPAAPERRVGEVQILFFTGIRYVRDADTEADEAAPTDSAPLNETVLALSAREAAERLQA